MLSFLHHYPPPPQKNLRYALNAIYCIVTVAAVQKVIFLGYSG